MLGSCYSISQLMGSFAWVGGAEGVLNELVTLNWLVVLGGKEHCIKTTVGLVEESNILQPGRQRSIGTVYYYVLPKTE